MYAYEMLYFLLGVLRVYVEISYFDSVECIACCIINEIVMRNIVLNTILIIIRPPPRGINLKFVNKNSFREQSSEFCRDHGRVDKEYGVDMIQLSKN